MSLRRRRILIFLPLADSQGQSTFLGFLTLSPPRLTLFLRSWIFSTQWLKEPNLVSHIPLWVVCSLLWVQSTLSLLDGKGYKSSVKCPILFNFLTPTIFSHLNLPLLSSLNQHPTHNQFARCNSPPPSPLSSWLPPPPAWSLLRQPWKNALGSTLFPSLRRLVLLKPRTTWPMLSRAHSQSAGSSVVSVEIELSTED